MKFEEKSYLEMAKSINSKINFLMFFLCLLLFICVGIIVSNQQKIMEEIKVSNRITYEEIVCLDDVDCTITDFESIY